MLHWIHHTTESKCERKLNNGFKKAERSESINRGEVNAMNDVNLIVDPIPCHSLGHSVNRLVVGEDYRGACVSIELSLG